MIFSSQQLLCFCLALSALTSLTAHALPSTGVFKKSTAVRFGAESLITPIAVFPHDARKELTDSSSPWRAIGLLTIPDGSLCTASLIGPNLALTNSHCVADKDKKRIRQGNYFFKAQYRNGKASAVSSVKQIVTGGYHISKTGREGDWAILVLNKRLGDELGWFGICDYETGDLLNITDHYKLYMAGYAGDFRKGEVPTWQGNCSFHKEYFGKASVLTHDCSTTAGASGSPMFIFAPDKDGKKRALIVALHSGSQFGFIKEVSEKGKMVMFSDTSANLAVHASEFLGAVRKLRVQED